MRNASLRLLREVTESLGWRYIGFVVATILFALVAMLPPELLVFFTGSAQALSAIAAPAFLARLSLFGGLIALALFASSVGNTFSHEWLRLRIEADLRRRILWRIHGVPLAELDGMKRGDWMGRVTRDLEMADWFLVDSIPSQIRQGAILVGAGSLFLFRSGWIAALPLLTALCLALSNLKLQKKLARDLVGLRELHGSVLQLLIESLEGVRTIRSHGAEPFVQRRFDAHLAAISSVSLRLIRFVGLLFGANELMGQLFVTVCLSAVAWNLSKSALTVEQCLVYPFFIGMFYQAAQSLAGSVYGWHRFFAEGGRLAAVLYGEPERVESLCCGGETSPAPVSLRVTRLSVGYRGRPVAGPIDLDLVRGEVRAIVGPSGSGKSTFLEVVAGLRPPLGGAAELLDDAGRSVWALRQKPAGALLPRAAFAYVEQRPYLFEGSLKENLVFGNASRASDALIWSVLEKVGLARFVVQLPGGLEYPVPDRGATFSEGERYRIALCRAILLKRPFLLLDEPFAALDSASLSLVVNLLEKERSTSGILLVTHYLPRHLPLDGLLDFEIPAASFPHLAEAGSSSGRRPGTRIRAASQQAVSPPN